MRIRVSGGSKKKKKNNNMSGGKYAPTMATPLQTYTPHDETINDDDDHHHVDDDDVKEEEEEEQQQQHSQNHSSSKGKEIMHYVSLPRHHHQQQPFILPDDWVVEERPRPYNPSIRDRYYYEPGTGRQFRSLASVQRYLTEGIITDMRSRTTERMISKKTQVITHAEGSKSFVKLPRDWIVKKRARNSNYAAGVTDMTDIEPGTGQRFRSLKAVERYLTGENACTPATTKVPKLSKQLVVKSGIGKQGAPGVKSCLKTVEKRSSVSKPPAKVKWVLSGSGGGWNPFLDDSIVPDSEKMKWSEAFALSIHDGVY
ncbi:hypothetical protein RIF29_27758 [Crotalaria pallida]|uniref:MBD domain-containing protein n=1 Tax=Crotalaria pallida TaxID=3830 RepID=A0AAN9I5X1_CROPI